MNHIILILSLSFLLISCKETQTIYIAGHLTDCIGVVAQKCMRYKENLDDAWIHFYDTIEGFEYEEGYKYKLEVGITKIKKPFADTLSLHYSLVKIISKEKETTTIHNNNSIQNNDLSITYQALSRGYFTKTKISKHSIALFKDRNLKNIISKSCSKKEWDSVLYFLKNIKIEKINELKAPTGKRLYDGAPHASLKITKADQTFASTSFDHGKPPEEIELLVNYILSLAESIE